MTMLRVQVTHKKHHIYIDLCNRSADFNHIALSHQLSCKLLVVWLTEESTGKKYCEEDEDSGLSLYLALDDDCFCGPIKVVMATSLPCKGSARSLLIPRALIREVWGGLVRNTLVKTKLVT